MVPTGHCTKLIIRTKNMKYFIKLTGMEYSLVHRPHPLTRRYGRRRAPAGQELFLHMRSVVVN